MATNNSIFGLQGNDPADVPVNPYPQNPQADPQQYYQLAQQLQQAQVSQRNQEQALNGGQIQFPNEQARNDFFNQRNIQNQQIASLQGKLQQFSPPTQAQVAPVNFSQTPLVAGDPNSQIARLQMTGQAGLVMSPDQQKNYRQYKDDQVAARTGIDPHAMDKWQGYQGKTTADLNLDPQSLLQNPDFHNLMQKNPQAADQVMQAISGRSINDVASATQQMQQTQLTPGNKIVDSALEAGHLNILNPQGDYVRAEVVNPTLGLVKYFSSKGNPQTTIQNGGNDPSNPIPDPNATVMAIKKSLTTPTLMGGRGHIINNMLKNQQINQQGQAPTATTPPAPTPSLPFASLQNGQGASPTPANSPWSIPSSPSVANPDWNGDPALAPQAIQSSPILQGIANVGQSAVAVASRYGQATLEAALGRESGEENTPEYTDIGPSRSLSPTQLALLKAKKGRR